MNEWPDVTPPEYEQIRAQLRGHDPREPAPGRSRPRRARARVRRINVVRFSVVLMSLAVCYMATYDVWGLGLPAWIGGLMILTAAGTCYAVERWTP